VSQCDRSAMREWRLVQEIALGAGTAGWIRTTDLLIHSKFSLSDASRHDPTCLAADPSNYLVSP
jgi:hypothetical protein